MALDHPRLISPPKCVLFKSNLISRLDADVRALIAPESSLHVRNVSSTTASSKFYRFSFRKYLTWLVKKGQY